MKIVQKDNRWEVVDGVDDTVLASFAEQEDASRYRVKKGDEK
jgi:3-methyladenine DNA glycosylase AlkD